MSEYTMRITGVGSISAVSDQAVAEFLVYAHSNESMEDALQAHSAKIAAVCSTIQAHDVPDKQVKTTLYRYGPVYKNKRDDNGENKTYLDGYDCTQQLCVRIPNLSRLPSLITHLAPETHLQNVTFGVSNYDELREEAISRAIMDAMDRAQLRADQLEVKVEQVVGYDEPVDYNSPVRTRGGARAQFASAAPEASPQLPLGENEITVTVMVTFRIR